MGSTMECVFVAIMSVAIVCDGVKALKNAKAKKDFRLLNFLFIPAFTFGVISRFLLGANIVVKCFYFAGFLVSLITYAVVAGVSELQEKGNN